MNAIDTDAFIEGNYTEEHLYGMTSMASETITQKRKKEQAGDGVFRITLLGHMGVIELYGDYLKDALPGVDGDGFDQRFPDMVHNIFNAYWEGQFNKQQLDEFLFYGIQQGYEDVHSPTDFRKFAVLIAGADSWYLQETNVVSFN